MFVLGYMLLQLWYYIWFSAHEKISKKLVKTLKKKKLKISFAESCTGGLLASSITSIKWIF